MASNFVEYYVQLVDSRLQLPINDTTGQFYVCTANSPVLATVYTNALGTSLTQPGTIGSTASASGGVVRFFAASTVTSVDLFVYAANGQAYYIAGLTPSAKGHSIGVDPMRTGYVAQVPFTSSTTEVPTPLVFPANVVLRDVFLNVTATQSSSTMSVGILSSQTGGATNMFLAAAAVSATGLVTGFPTASQGANSQFVGATTVGTSLASALTGSNSTNGTTNGAFVRQFYLTNGTAKTLSYIHSASTTAAQGYVFVGYDLLQAQI